MSLLVRSLLLIALLFPAPLLAEETRRPTPTIGAQIEEFGLSDPRGKTWTLADFDDNPIVVVVFMGTECPLMKLYAPRLANMATEFADHGVAFVGINSNQQDGLSEIANYARVHKIAFPILKDPGNRVADQFGATRTPQVFVLDAQRRVRYHGSIDDQYHYGIQRQKADHENGRASCRERV